MKLPDIPAIRGIFVTGTDTNVGKTQVAAGLTAALRQQGIKAGYFKPVQSGCPEEGGRLIPTDARIAQELADLPEPLNLLTPITLRLPLAPGVAAAREGVKVDLERVAAALRELARRYDFLVVEGAGGL
ncbi:MAG: dethiobiotin synthase, partial [Syntrophales bacterium]|nr:dethiobiotin synthase [Syntrophales bacterium]